MYTILITYLTKANIQTTCRVKKNVLAIKGFKRFEQWPNVDVLFLLMASLIVLPSVINSQLRPH